MLPKAPIANGTIGWLPDFFLLLVRGGARWGAVGGGGGGNSTVVSNFAPSNKWSVHSPSASDGISIDCKIGQPA